MTNQVWYLLILPAIVFGCDSCYQDPKPKLPYNNHDSNMITLHRVKNFRSLVLDLKPDFTATAKQ